MKRLKKDAPSINLFMIGLILILGFPTIIYQRADSIEKKIIANAEALAYDETIGVLSIEGAHALILNNMNGRMLYEKSTREVVPLASLFKIATVLAYLRTTTADTSVTITQNAVTEIGDTGLADGMKFTRDDILSHLLMASSNDAVAAIAHTREDMPSDTLDSAVQDLLAQYNLTDITFSNLTGLDIDEETDGARGSAFSMAVLANELYKTAPELALATTKTAATFQSFDGRTVETQNVNHDESILDRVIFSKTGFTNRAGGNLLTIMKYGSEQYTFVVLGSSYEGRFTDMEKMLSAARRYSALRDSYIEKAKEERYTNPLWYLIS